MKDKSRVPLFGDGGTAMALEYDVEAHDIIIDFHTFDKGAKSLMIPHGDFHHPATPDSFEYEDFANGIVKALYHTMINGMNVLVIRIANRLRKEETALLCSSFGLGLSWGTMLLRTKPMVVSQLLFC